MVSDFVSGIHIGGLAVGEFVGPLVGNALYLSFGFEWTCDIMSLVLLGFTGVHILFCDILPIREKQAD